MAVNGVEIRLGQVWRMRDGDTTIVAHYRPGVRYCWEMTPAVHYAHPWTVCVDADGCVDDAQACDGDLITLLQDAPSQVADDHEALTFAPLAPSAKLSNPKDAIGDTKVPLWLLSPIAKAQWAVAQFVGLVKYGAWNWRVAGVRSSTYLSAMNRHFDAYISGEELDPRDGTPHLGHIMACAAILIDAKAAGKLTDDRPPSVSLRQSYAEVEAQMVKVKTLYADRPAPRHYTIADTEVSK